VQAPTSHQPATQSPKPKGEAEAAGNRGGRGRQQAGTSSQQASQAAGCGLGWACPFPLATVGDGLWVCAGCAGFIYLPISQFACLPEQLPPAWCLCLCLCLARKRKASLAFQLRTLLLQPLHCLLSKHNKTARFTRGRPLENPPEKTEFVPARGG